jgi:predicted O-methyltransferase YrrM
MDAYKGCPNVHVLEIGSDEGRSAVWFLTNVVTHPTARLTCIDPFFRIERRLVFDHNIEVSEGSSRTSTIVGTSADVLPTLPRQSFDIVYVDGSHRAADVLLDALESWQLLKPGGILLFDDYGWHPERPLSTRPQLGIDLFLETFNGEYDLLLKEYQVAIRKQYGCEPPVPNN